MTLDERLEKNESMLIILGQRQKTKEFYTAEAFVDLGERECYTVRAGDGWAGSMQTKRSPAEGSAFAGNSSCRHV